MRRPLALLIAAAGLVGGCQKTVQAPTNVGVCWHMVVENGKAKYNKVADHVDTLEKCAADLEGMRRRFLGLGGSASEITGAYQGSFIFLQRDGIYVGQTLEPTARYLFLVRTPDGLLTQPGAAPPGS